MFLYLYPLFQVDTVKFGLSLWFLTYIGAWFNAMTLIVLAWLAAFSLPKAYLMNQVGRIHTIDGQDFEGDFLLWN